MRVRDYLEPIQKAGLTILAYPTSLRKSGLHYELTDNPGREILAKTALGGLIFGVTVSLASVLLNKITGDGVVYESGLLVMGSNCASGLYEYLRVRHGKKNKSTEELD